MCKIASLETKQKIVYTLNVINSMFLLVSKKCVKILLWNIIPNDLTRNSSLQTKNTETINILLASSPRSRQMLRQNEMMWVLISFIKILSYIEFLKF